MHPFGPETSRVFLFAIAEAQQLGHGVVEPAHILIGLARLGGPVSQVLLAIGLPAARLRTLAARHLQGQSAESILYSQAVRRLVRAALERAEGEALTPQHLLLALSEQSGLAARWLRDTGELPRLKMMLEDGLALSSPQSEGFE